MPHQLSHTTFLAALLFASIHVFTPHQLAAQKPSQDDGPVGVFSSRTEYDQFMGTAKRTAYGPDGSPELQAMIPMLNDIALNQPIGMTAEQYDTAERSTLGLLSDKAIRGEIEMIDSQYDQLQNLNTDIQKRMAQQIRGLDFSNTDSLVDRIRQLRDQAQTDLNSLLLPHQLERLQEIRMQSLLRRRSLVDVLTNDPIKSKVKITDEQSDELREAEKEIAAELRQKIAKLQEEAREQLLSRLKPAQKQEVKKMIGDAFEFANAENKTKAGSRAKQKPTKGTKK